MNRYIVLFLAMICSVGLSAQTTLLSEDFESGVLPPGWVRTQNFPSVGWQIGSTLGSTNFPIPPHTTYAASNDDAHDNSAATQNLADLDYLITPPMNFSPFSSTGVVLEFEYIQPGNFGSTGSIEISINSGAWIVIEQLPHTTTWQRYTVDLSAFAPFSNIRVGFHHDDSNQRAEGFGIDDVVIKELLPVDGEMEAVTVPEYVTVGDVDMMGSIYNAGSDPITSLDVNYSINGSLTFFTATLTGLNIASLTSYEFTHPTPFNVDSATIYDVCMWVSNVNGGGLDPNLSNDTLCGSFNALTYFPARKSLVEVHTGAWVPLGPDGWVKAEEVRNNYGENAIVCEVHNDDAMEIPDGLALANTYVTVFPSGTIDRMLFDTQATVATGRDVWDTLVGQSLAVIEPVAVTIDTVAFDSVSREYSVTLSAEFVGEISGDMRFNAFVVEDSVIGFGTGFDQANAFNGQNGHPFFGAGNPISGFTHRNVVREMLGGSWGASGSIPASVLPGDVYTMTFTDTLPLGYDEEKISIVGLVQRYDANEATNRSVMNAESAPLIAPCESLLGDFSYSINGLTVSFTDNTENGPSNWLWTFDDGTNNSTLQNPTHSFTAPGTYYVCLRTMNRCDTTEVCQSITVGPAICSNEVTTGSMSNIYAQTLAESNQVIASNMLNTIIYVHRNDSGAFIGHPGHLRYDFSTDGGNTWTLNQGFLNPFSLEGQNSANYPQVSIYNTPGNTTPTDAYIVYQAATESSAGLNGYVSGVRRLNGTGNTENYNQASSTNNYIPRGQVQGVQGTYWALDAMNDGTTFTGIRVLKGMWNNTDDVVWNEHTTFTPSFVGTPQISSYNIAFSPNGMTGWICLLTHITGGPTDAAFYPVFYKTTNGGATWSGPMQVDLSAYSCISDNINAGSVPTCGFDMDLVVDINGNPHAFVTVGNSTADYTIDYSQWHAMFDIMGVGGIWSPMEVANVQAGRGYFGLSATDSIHMDMHPQASRTEDGRKVFFGWTDTDTAVTGSLANEAPNLFVRAYHIERNRWSPTKEVTSCNASVAGHALYPKMAPVVLGLTGTYTLPTTVVELSGSGSPNATAGSHYLNGITITDTDFGIPQCEAEVEIAPVDTIIICQGAATTLDAGAGADEYIWSTGETTQTITVPTGFYTVIVRSGCCIGMDTVAVAAGLPPTPDFAADTSTNLTVAFSDISGGSPPAGWLWDFGDGNTSTLQNPSHSYAEGGDYFVCLTTTNECGSNTTCRIVSVSCPFITPFFLYQANDLEITFQDGSIGQLPNVAWFWDFGDGNISTNQDPVHTYTMPGVYDVCLIVANECRNDTFCQQINVTCPAPLVSFIQASDNLEVTFSNTTVGGAFEFAWDFGDGNTSTFENPLHTFEEPGTYPVCLTATNICGSASSCQVVTVVCPASDANFGISADGLSVQFTDSSNNDPLTILWDFGDGGQSTQANPLHNYTDYGTYTVCFTVTNECDTTVNCQQIVLTCPNPEVNFNATSVATTVDFMDMTPGSPTSWAWDFGDGNVSFVQNPTYTYASFGTYTVCLTATDSCGTNTICKSVEVTCEPEEASFMFGMDGLTVNFSDQTMGAPSAWIWSFGDGNSSSFQNPSHTYAAAGTYDVCLIISDDCGTDSVCQTIEVGATSIDLELLLHDLEVYPNPTQGLLTVKAELAEPMNLELKLVDMLGRTQIEMDLPPTSGLMKEQLDMSGLSSGVYFLHIMGEGGELVQKIVKE